VKRLLSPLVGCLFLLAGAGQAVAGVSISIEGNSRLHVGDTLTFVVSASGEDAQKRETLFLLAGSKICYGNPAQGDDGFILSGNKTISCTVPEFQEPGRFEARVEAMHSKSNSVFYIVEPPLPVRLATVYPSANLGLDIDQRMNVIPLARMIIQGEEKLYSLIGLASLRSNDPTIASVDENGTVVGVKPGHTSIDVLYQKEDGILEVITSIAVTVNDVAAMYGVRKQERGKAQPK